MPRVKRERRVPVANQLEISKTPESELLTVEEYFDKVWNRYLEKVVTVREQLQ